MSEVIVRITAPLRRFTNGLDRIPVKASSVGEALNQVCSTYPNLNGRILDSSGALRQFIQVYIGKQNASDVGGLAAPLSPGAVVSITSPFSGG
jgi:molybdopterin converting factor small subunit